MGLFHLSRKGLYRPSQCVFKDQKTSKALSWRYLSEGSEGEGRKEGIKPLIKGVGP
jgi:hypothetical protein